MEAKKKVSVYSKWKAEKSKGVYDKSISKQIKTTMFISVEHAERVNKNFKNTGVFFKEENEEKFLESLKAKKD